MQGKEGNTKLDWNSGHGTGATSYAARCPLGQRVESLSQPASPERKVVLGRDTAMLKSRMRNAAQTTIDPSTETDVADDIADHSPPALLAQHLRTTRQHIAQAIEAMREVAALSDDDDWEKQTDQLGRIASFVEDRCTLFDLGQRSFLLPDQFQRFATVVRQRREAAHLSRN